MSGIFGFYYLDSQLAKPEVLQKMSNTLTHRGSDGSDIWYGDTVGLGHRLFWTTPESLWEKQPLVDSSNYFIITSDARIDNRDELIASLNLNNFSQDRITDVDIILAAYKEWGEQCPARLIGDFAFAIWDKRYRKLFCARDPMGVKPFYYYHCQKVFVFASELTALFCLPEVPKRLNELKVAQYLNINLDDKEITFYEKIVRLLPGHSLVSKLDGSISLKSYYSLDPKQEFHFKTQDEYTEAFLEKFTEAVQCRLRSAFPVGSTLSGGLDSSSIACLANKLLKKAGNQKIHTFSAIFPNLPEEDRKWIDERHYINEVVNSGDFVDHYVEADKLNPIIDLLWRNEEPILGANLYIHSGLYKCANDHGVRVFLDGLDGDTTISHGWRYLAELIYKGRWLKLVKEVSAASKVFQRSRKFILRQFCFAPFMEASSDYTQHKWHQLQNTVPFSQLINPDFATEIKFTEHLQSSSDSHDFFNLSDKYQQWQNLTSGMYPYILEMADKSTARFSVEARYPFFDRRLVEFCLALPPEQKFRQGWSRAILRSAMTNVLPKSVQWRTSKGNLSYSLNNRLVEVEHEALKQLAEESAIKPYVNTSFLDNTVERFINQPKKANQDSMNLVSSLTLARWLANSKL